MPDVLEDGCPRGDTNTSTDEDGDFVLKYVLSGSTIRSINTESGHLVTVLKSDFVHAHGVDIIVELGLSSTSTKSITQFAGKVSNLTDVDRHIGVEWARSDREWMPLVLGERRHLDEKPLASLVLERRLVELNLNHIVGVSDDSGDLGLTAGSDLTPETLDQVETTGPELPSPSQVTDAVGPELITSKRRDGLGSVSHEASHGMGVETKEKRDKKMVSVPESLKGLLTNTGVGGRVHEKHAEKHDMTGDTTSLDIVNLKGGNGSDLGQFDVVEVDIVSAGVEDGEEEDGVCELAMHPQVLVEREESNLGSNPSHDSSADREKDQHAVDAQNETGATGDPD